VADWCDQCHRKKGLVVWPDLPRLTPEHPQGEALAALLLGKIDAFEVCRLSDPQAPALADWYRLLACGRRVPLMGASGKDRNTVALGTVRTYARLEPGQELSYGAWIESVRAGRTFVTEGPLLSLAVNGQDPGSVLSLANEGQTVRVQAVAHSVTPFARLECLYNGAVVAAGAPPSSPPQAGGMKGGWSATFEANVPIAGSGWLAARCLGGVNDSAIVAHTSPVYVQLEGRPLRLEADTMAPLLAVLEGTLAWVRTEARCPQEAQREQLMQTLRSAKHVLITKY
jgi:hypothetical protein